MPDDNLKKKFDVAISFAGEDRKWARQIKCELERYDLRVFFDEDQNLVGEELTEYLGRIYSQETRSVLMLISSHYASKPWTRHERRHALSTAIQQESSPYIFPIRLDSTVIPGLPDSVAYLKMPPETASSVAKAIAAKFSTKPHVRPLPQPRRINRRIVLNILGFSVPLLFILVFPNLKNWIFNQLLTGDPSQPDDSRGPDPVRVDNRSELPTDVDERLVFVTERYSQFLQAIGFGGSFPAVARITDPETDIAVPNAGYIVDQGTFWVSQSLAGDLDILLSQYTHHILTANAKTLISRDDFLTGSHDSHGLYSIELALTRYLACSYQNDPFVGETFVARMEQPRAYLFNINDLSVSFNSSDTPDNWKGWLPAACFFWECRHLFGADTVDRAVASSWRAMNNIPSDTQLEAALFMESLHKDLARTTDRTQRKAFGVSLRRRGFDFNQ